MARTRKTTNTTKKTATFRRGEKQRAYKTDERGSLLDYFKLTESYASLLLGIIVVIIAATLIFSFLKNRNLANFTNTKKDISATKTVSDSQMSPSMTEGGTYTVQAGDDLWKIAEKTYNDGYKWTEIAKANNITNPSMIAAGQKLTLPKLSQTVAEASSPTPMPTTVVSPTPATAVVPSGTSNQQNTSSRGQPINGMTYTVVRGDYLWEIAERAYGDGYKWVDIAKANNLVNPSIIHSGNVLTIPRKG